MPLRPARLPLRYMHTVLPGELPCLSAHSLCLMPTVQHLRTHSEVSGMSRYDLSRV